MTDLAPLLSAFMTRALGPGAIAHLGRLSGGANMESWAFDWAGEGYVLRRAPSAEYMADRPYGHPTEAALVKAAYAAGVKAPEVVGVLADSDGMGTGYVMRRVIAEVSPAKILASPPPSLVADLGRELALIHAIPAETIPDAIPHMDAAAALAELKARFLTYGGDRPAIALAIKWCEDHLPEAAPPVLVHGDYRMGNIMVDGDGLAVVLDWELAHRGDAHEDLAFGCMTVWRFGQLDKPAFGVGSLEGYFAAYEAAGGAPVDRDRFRFWLVYRTLWWALGCLQMGQAWRSGADTTVERVVVGRRTAEQELDLIALLEAEAPEAERARALQPSPSAGPAPVGEPTNREIVQAVREWIEGAIKPHADGHAKFEAVVAMNALGIVMRDLDAGARAEDAALSAALMAGTTTLAEPGLLARLRRAVLDKCAVDSPKYAALAAARSRWGG
ncbi:MULTISPECIES: phosphotransferase family protein [unclassified Sphingopyxis]|uniref:phosphotransferase family protein n=1 Tax=unclassified Sphingopyxis TaxID=2614943 RepID=UPI000736690A|nr:MULTISPECIES: phosphotransferase family protein [unclassified Sphingopyxis]KTE29755.1 tyrosine protein kinase [Sphingopyxis sp. HIX]KTE79669.1 tyrosine protein kinase [Sphingopyxis sp. HXXIV]